MSLKEPYYVKKPTSKLVGKDRAAIIGKSLSEFIEQYQRETDSYISTLDANNVKVPMDLFEAFLSSATETGFVLFDDFHYSDILSYFRY